MKYVKHHIRRDQQVFTKDEIVAEKVISISFKNIGTVDAKIGNFPLAVGDPMVTFGNDAPNEDITEYNLTFDSNVAGKRVIVFYTRIVETFTLEAPEKHC